MTCFRELKSEKSRTPVVNVVDENTVTITNIKVSVSGAGDSRKRIRSYNADYIINDSVIPGTSPHDGSQEKVYNTIGRQVLASVSNGISACVLAYGQSATGKTYTMMGTETQPGLIPRLCMALGEQNMDITVSFLEIYNERVHDLLASEVLPCNSLPRRKGNAWKDLRVREHPNKGPYVQNLRRVLVHDLESLLSVVSEGKRRRRTAATRRNCSSSRSHAVLELATPLATLQLVDLAGSEKAGQEGYACSRQKEGANINKSLVALSNVISALVSGGGPGRFVPYRDSALTWLLKDCFTGGANTFIIATISPSTACYGESASTLRWAARTRQLPPKRANAAVNLTTKAALQAQYNQLLRELTKHFIRYIPETGKLSFDENHWKLNNTSLSDVEQAAANIGNIMNFSRPKIDEQNVNIPTDAIPDDNPTGNQTVFVEEINKEIDKMFAPPFERARSGSDFEIVAPIKHKKRQYRSQEVLSTNKTSQQSTTKHNLSEISPSVSEERLDEINSLKAKSNMPTSLLYDNNQRAEIVASVTERLYSKLKRNEEVAGKLDANVDKKLIQPLSELKICTNARQRLMELSQKALRNKRRIGIPAYTQTKKFIVRVKDQAIDVQSELLPYECIRNNSCVFQRDVGTETISITPRYKEVSVGSDHGYLHFKHSSTMTDNRKIFKTSSTMTIDVIQNDRCTQTCILPPPRRKRRPNLLSKYIKSIENRKNNSTNAAPIININISPMYDEDSDSQNSDSTTAGNAVQPQQQPPLETKILPPDLLTNHNNFISNPTIEKHKIDEIRNKDIDTDEDSIQSDKTIDKPNNNLDDFSNDDDITLPRTSIGVDDARVAGYSDIKDMILGRNADMYPYNIAISPLRERNASGPSIRFLDKNAESDEDFVSLENSSFHFERSESKYLKEIDSFSSDSTVSNETNSDFGRCKSNNFSKDKKRNIRNHSSYSNNININTDIIKNTFEATKGKLYKEYLGLDRKEINDETCSNCSLNIKSVPKNGDRLNNIYRKGEILSKGNNDDKNDTFENVHNEIKNSCRRLEFAVNNYEVYLDSHRRNKEHNIKSPTKYLQHLIEIRKGLVEEEKLGSSSTDGI
ncbi:centromere-associated protein E-like [Colias croceus]|uniref:centromere-associated protein E-like n=1 Tax=Colias crocea TaxID=72248 RepID=UPI001E279FB9|nr:centromere-associated protein E-like [Colias croceus]